MTPYTTFDYNSIFKTRYPNIIG